MSTHHNQPTTESTSRSTNDPVGDAPDRRRYYAGLAAALLVAAGLGGVAVAQGAADAEAHSERGTAQRAAVAQSTTDSLDDVTLDELAEELERLGLEVSINPAGAPTDDSDGPASSDQDDPFAGMSQEEIDDLSDEEFFAMLEEAGIEPEYLDDPYEDGDTGTDDDTDNDVGTDDDTDETGSDHHDHDEEAGEEPLATLAVDGDRIDTSGLAPDVAEQAEAIWQRFVTLIPADQRQMLANFELLPEEYGGAHVYPTDADPTKWTMGVGLGLGEDLDYVLIHEFAHLLTLQATEVPPGEDTGSCPTYHTGEGCALKGSTFAKFVNAFWPEEMRNKVFDLYENEDYDGLDEFYAENADSFVTDYAASNPAEDLAETFAVFVTKDRPTGDSIADQKVNMLWADEDMVKLRAEIRANV